MTARVGIDVGGTFTDLLMLDSESGAIRLLKTPSTPHDQSVGIEAGITGLIAEAGVAPAEIRGVLHGTTVPTNIVLEEKGARVGLLVTENFEQVLHLARSQTPGPLAGWIIMEKPDPLADLEHTRGISERLNARGDIVTPLDEGQARRGDCRVAGRRCRIDHRVVAAFLCQPGARTALGRDHRRTRRRNPGVAVVGNPARVPRIRAHAGDRDERVCRTQHAALSARFRGPVARALARLARQYRALRRRPDEP